MYANVIVDKVRTQNWKAIVGILNHGHQKRLLEIEPGDFKAELRLTPRWRGSNDQWDFELFQLEEDFVLDGQKPVLRGVISADIRKELEIWSSHVILNFDHEIIYYDGPDEKPLLWDKLHRLEGQLDELKTTLEKVVKTVDDHSHHLNAIPPTAISS